MVNTSTVVRIRLSISLCFTPETLFFINHDQPQILKRHILLQQPVCADHNIHFPGLQLLQDLSLLLFIPETAQGLNKNGIFGKPFQEIVIMLLGKHGCRYKNGSLTPRHDTFEYLY